MRLSEQIQERTFEFDHDLYEWQMTARHYGSKALGALGSGAKWVQKKTIGHGGVAHRTLRAKRKAKVFMGRSFGSKISKKGTLMTAAKRSGPVTGGSMAKGLAGHTIRGMATGAAISGGIWAGKKLYGRHQKKKAKMQAKLEKKQAKMAGRQGQEPVTQGMKSLTPDKPMAKQTVQSRPQTSASIALMRAQNMQPAKTPVNSPTLVSRQNKRQAR